MSSGDPKELVWIGSSRKDIKGYPLAVRRAFGLALYAAQKGEWPPDAKALKGFGGTGVLEIIEDHRGDTYPAVYTIRFATVVYVLHVFQKKSKHGVSTPQRDIDLIKERLKKAEQLHEQGKKGGKP
ncbi:type II toxin-antitoxin system RelE/ParE family toxin [Desulfolutivibrio sp.]|uniref:type II toxin-antitoxin system RelE/ParE family toxin n=1 Tax=Desulfolutivibrio sp. TaxID=2773296 RepID=UPI002F96260C